MRYKGHVENTKRILKRYKDKIDGIIVQKQMNDAETDRAIEAHKDMWSEQYKAEYRKSHENTEKLRRMVKQEQEQAKKKLDSEMAALDKELNSYFMGTARSNFVSTLMGYQNLGVQLSNNELKKMVDNVTTYSEARMVKQFAENIIKDNPDYFDSDIFNRIIDPITLPDYDATMKVFNDFKQTAEFLVSDYCGTQAQGHDLVETAGDRVFSVNADAFLRGRAVEAFCKIAEACNDLLPLEVRNKLTEEESALLDRVIPDYAKYPNYACTQAREIAATDAYMCELMQLDPRYSKAVEGVENEA